MNELLAKLDSIQRLLIILLSEPKYKAKMEDLQSDLYAEYGERINRLFPSDPEYRSLEIQSQDISDAVRQILSNIEFSADE